MAPHVQLDAQRLSAYDIRSPVVAGLMTVRESRSSPQKVVAALELSVHGLKG
jgi:hypothetical protein